MTIKPIISQQEEPTPSGVQHDNVLQHGMGQLSMMPYVRDESGDMSEDLFASPDQPVYSDYDLQPSPNGLNIERKLDETDAQYKERVLNLRAAQLFAVVKPKLSAGQEVSFTDVAPMHYSRKEVAQKFYSLLLLKNQQILKIEQNDSDVPVTICKGSRFETEAI